MRASITLLALGLAVFPIEGLDLGAAGLPERAPEFVYLPGMIGRDPATGELPAGVEAQTRQAIANISAALEARGLGLSDVVRSNVYLTDTRHFQAMNGVYRTFFTDAPPTRATVEADLPVPGALVQITVAAAPAGASRRVIVPASMQSPALPYSWGVQVGNTLFVAGATSRNPDTYEPEAGDIGAQTRRVLQNVGLVLEEAGMDYGDVVSCNVFLDDPRLFGAMNEAYTQFFTGDDPPARATVRSGLMNPVFLVEIQCTAVRDASREVVMAPGASRGSAPYSPAIGFDDVVYLAGTLGRGPSGYAPGDAAAQTRQTMENLRAVLTGGGMDFTNVVETTVFVTDIRTADAVDEIVRELVPEGSAVTTVGAGLMSTAALVEIMMTARR